MKKIVITTLVLLISFSSFGQKKLYFDNIGDFKNGYAIVRKGNITGFIDTLGNELKITNVNLKNDSYGQQIGIQKNGFFVNSKNKDLSLKGEDGIRDTNGKYIIEPKHRISNRNEFYILQNTTNFFKPTKYEVLNGKCKSIFKTSGNFRSKKPVIPLSDKIIAISNKETYPYLYKIVFLDLGTETDYIFEDFGKMCNGLIKASKYVESEGKFKWGFMDKNGNTVIDFMYTNPPGDFNNGLAVVKNTEGKFGYINRKNEIVIPVVFFEAYQFMNDRALVKVHKYQRGNGKTNNGYRIIDKTGTTLYDLKELKPIYIPYDYYKQSVIENNDIIRLHNSKSKKILLDLREGKLIETSYFSINAFDSGLALVSTYEGNGKYKYGYINKKGELVFIKANKNQF